MHLVQIVIGVETKSNKITLTGEYVHFNKEIRPRHVRLASQISEKVKEITKIVLTYKENNPEEFDNLVSLDEIENKQ